MGEGQIRYCDLNGDGFISDLDKTILGNPNPDFTYGLSTSFSWKGLSLSASIDGVYGSQIVNANRVQIHALAYNLFNWFRRLTLPDTMKRDRVDTLRLKLLKIAARVVHSARYVFFKLCSYCPFQAEVYETLSNIRHLHPLLE